ncbi:MAG: hypothetical protein ACPGED_12905, partial [Flavobacteriales bacterium]
AQFWDKWSKHRVQAMIELSEEDFTVSQAYKQCQADWNENGQEDWKANEFQIYYLNQEGD